MSVSLGTDLWDKPDAIILFNENNSITLDKLQKNCGDFCKSQLVNTLTQKRVIERFLTENDALKKSQFSFSSNAYFLLEQLYYIMNTQETFNSALLNEVDEIIKVKNNNLKKDSRLMKADNKNLLDDLAKENQKLENSLKRYRMTFNLMEASHNAFLKAEENKMLSRNQVDSYKTTYLMKQAQYDEAKSEYMSTLNSYNHYQSKHYGTLLKEWGNRAYNIENERYSAMRMTFTSVSELFKSMATKFTDIADQIESRIDTIDCEQDCLALINREKTGDVPPRDVPFKDLDVREKVDIDVPRVSNTSNSGSDSASSNGGSTRKGSLVDQKPEKSISLSNSNKENATVTNSTASSGISLFGKLFGGGRKSKETPIVQVQPPDTEEVKSVQVDTPIQIDNCYAVVEIKTVEITSDETLTSLTNDCTEEKISPTLSTEVSSSQKLLRKGSVDNNQNSSSNMGTLIKRSRGSFRNLFEKRRSRSLSGLAIVDGELSVSVGDKPAIVSQKPKHAKDMKSLKPKPSMKPKTRDQAIVSSNRESILSRKIEVIRAVGEVEIVSTPAEAMAIAARSSVLNSEEHETYEEIYSENPVVIAETTCGNNSNQVYDYYYVGSCVAIHGYTSTDPSNIYLSFDIGEQFYIIKEDGGIESSGWLLVERIDRSQSGYVPASYMDTRKFDDPVLMHSDHAMLVM